MQRWVYKATCEGKTYECDLELPKGSDPKDHDEHLRPVVDRMSRTILADLKLPEGNVKCGAGCGKAAKGLMHRPMCYATPDPPVYSDSPDCVCGAEECVEKMNNAFRLAWESSKPNELRDNISCAKCDKPEKEKGTPLLRCSRCKVAHYCSLGCQRTHWKEGHKEACVKHDETKKESAGGDAPDVEVPQA